MDKILVTYATNSGSTVEVANTIGEQLHKSSASVQILPISEVRDLTPYSAIVLGGPMILGWHRQAYRFLRKNRVALAKKPLAVFVTCMSLTMSAEMGIPNLRVTIDENLPKMPKDEQHLTIRERYSLVSNYLRPILHACPHKPVSIGIFGGQLNFSKMKWWAMIFVVLILQAKAGDRRNWDSLRRWTTSLPALFAAAVAES